jgi:hypothetical protein
LLAVSTVVSLNYSFLENGFIYTNKLEGATNTMDTAAIYAARALPRDPLSPLIAEIISKLKISYKPSFRKSFAKRREAAESDAAANWRESALIDAVRKVREKDDPDYDEINAIINKTSKQTYAKLVGDVLEKLGKRDALFRLRVTTLLFDRGIRQNFYAPIMADMYADIAKSFPDARVDLATQVTMFDKLYDTQNVTLIPAASDPAYNDTLIAWTKQKEMKRGFAVYVGELYSRGLVPADTMGGFLNTVMEDLKESVRPPKTSANEEHVDALVRFLFAVASKVPLRGGIMSLLAIPKGESPNLNMKSRFKLDDAAKLSR